MPNLFILLLLWIFALPAHAQPPTQLTPETVRLSLAGHMSVFNDVSAKLSLQEVQEAAFVPLPGGLSFGFTQSAVWLRIDLERGSDAPRLWLMEIGNPLLDDVRLYVPLPQGGYAERRSGEDVPRGKWETDYRSPAFHLDLDQPGHYRIFLRVSARNALTTNVLLWQPESFHDKTRSESLLYGLYFGIQLFLLIFQLIFWIWTRERASAWFLFYVGLNFFSLALTAAYPQHYLELPGWFSDLLLGLSLCLLIPASSVFSSLQLELAKFWPRINRIYLGGAWLVGVATSAILLAGNYGLGVGIAQVYSLLGIIFIVSLSMVLAFRGYAPARLYLLSFGIFYLAVMLNYLRNLGILPPFPVMAYGVQIGSLLHIMVMSLGIANNYNQMKREKGLAQGAALEATRKLSESLEHEVQARLPS